MSAAPAIGLPPGYTTWEIQVGNDARLLSSERHTGSQLSAVRKAGRIVRATSPRLDVALFRVDPSADQPAARATMTLRGAAEDGGGL
jgi:hypothetical protein